MFVFLLQDIFFFRENATKKYYFFAFLQKSNFLRKCVCPNSPKTLSEDPYLLAASISSKPRFFLSGVEFFPRWRISSKRHGPTGFKEKVMSSKCQRYREAGTCLVWPLKPIQVLTLNRGRRDSLFHTETEKLLTRVLGGGGTFLIENNDISGSP